MNITDHLGRAAGIALGLAGVLLVVSLAAWAIIAIWRQIIGAC